MEESKPTYYDQLPDEAKSVFYGQEHLDTYLNVTLSTLKQILVDSSVRLMTKPKLAYSSMDYMGGFFYYFIIQFQNSEDPALYATVTEKDTKIPTWVVSFRQQLLFSEAVPDKSNPARYYIFIDYRRIPPPQWVKEKKVEHLLDNVINVRPIIQKQYEIFSKSLDKNDPLVQLQVPKYPKPVKKVLVAKNKRPEVKSQNIVDIFKAKKDAMDMDRDTELFQHLINPKEMASQLALRKAFMEFFTSSSMGNYTKHMMYKTFSVYMTQLMDQVRNTAKMQPSVQQFMLALLENCTKGMDRHEITPATEPGKCFLTGSQTSHLCTIIIYDASKAPVYQGCFDETKVQTMQNLCTTCHVLLLVMNQKSDLLVQLASQKKPAPNSGELIQKLGKQWEEYFVRGVILLHQFFGAMFR